MIFRRKKEGPVVKESPVILDKDTELALEFWRPENLAKIFEEEARDITRPPESGAKVSRKGFFLEKLWSAVDFRFTDYKNLEGKPTVSPRSREKLDELYPAVFHLNTPDIGEKIRIAQELRQLAEQEGYLTGWFSPESIESAAEANEELALEELRRIKQGEAPFGVKRNKDFVPQLDAEKIPHFTARSTLEDYRRLAQKRVKPQPRREEESDIPVDYSLG